MWSFDEDILRYYASRSWSFIPSSGQFFFEIASIINDGPVYKRPNSPIDFEIEKPATLVLRNVDSSYAGRYRFLVTGSSYVDVFVSIAGKFYEKGSSSRRATLASTPTTR